MNQCSWNIVIQLFQLFRSSATLRLKVRVTGSEFMLIYFLLLFLLIEYEGVILIAVD